ncbi:MAG: hypothetical protein ABTQ32_13185 [Myxococcaceae bacterium]
MECALETRRQQQSPDARLLAVNVAKDDLVASDFGARDPIEPPLATPLERERNHRWWCPQTHTLEPKEQIAASNAVA